MSRPSGAWIIAGLVALSACAGPGSPRIEGPAPDLDPSALIDVLPPDAIRSIDEPSFESIARAAAWLEPQSPVLAFEHGAAARAYPLGILTRHEIVNDTVNGTPVTVTYCPLCNSAVVYERSVAGRTLTFGVSGKLYHSDLVMFDRETESLWPQIQGVAVQGELRGTTLAPLPSNIVSFDDFRQRFPAGEVLSRPGDLGYGTNPYRSYDTGSGPNRAFFRAEVDERLEAMQRVVGVVRGREARAYPFELLADRRVISDRLGGEDLVVFWGGEAASALDTTVISEGRRVGASGVFAPVLDGRALTFVERRGSIVDRQTGSRWSHLGEAVAGELAGAVLEPIHHLDAFWFAWAAFVPFTDVFGDG